jgi:hypothetical protein
MHVNIRDWKNILFIIFLKIPLTMKNWIMSRKKEKLYNTVNCELYLIL